MIRRHASSLRLYARLHGFGAVLARWSVIAAIAYIVLLGGGYAGINLSILRLLGLVVAVIALTGWALLAWRRPRWRPRTAIWPALLLPYAALVLTTLMSPYPRLALDYVAWATLLIALYLLFVRLLRVPGMRVTMGTVMAGLGLLVSVTYILTVAEHWLEWWELLGRLTPPMLRPASASTLLGGPTVVAPVVILLAAAAFAGLPPTSALRRVALVALGMTTLMAVLLTGSRTAWLALAVSLVLMGIGALFTQRRHLAGWLSDRRVLSGVLSATGLGLLVMLVMLPGLLERVSTSGDGGRAYYAATAQRMFEESPWVGQGPGNWAARRIVFSVPGEPDIYIAHAHNTYLQTLAETGVVGALAGLAALGALLWLIVGAYREKDATRRRWATAALFVLIYVAVSALFDSWANLPAVLFLAALPFAVLDATSRSGVTDRLWQAGPTTQRRFHAGVTVLLFSACLVASVALVRIESLASAHERAVAAINLSAWDRAEEDAVIAVDADPEMVPYLVTRGLVAAQAGDWVTAEAVFGKAAAIDDLPESWIGLAKARLELGRPADEVLSAIERAGRIAGGDPHNLLASAVIFDQLGLDAKANEALADLLAADPSIAADPSWREDPGLSARFAAVLVMAMQRTAVPWQLAMMSGDAEAAAVLARASSTLLDDTVVAAWGGDAAAAATLADMALADPEDDELVSWAARVSAKSGDTAQADRFRRILTFDYEGLGQPGLETRILRQGSETMDGLAAAVHHYGRNAYRRATPGRLLVQGLPTPVGVDLSRQSGELGRVE